MNTVEIVFAILIYSLTALLILITILEYILNPEKRFNFKFKSEFDYSYSSKKQKKETISFVNKPKIKKSDLDFLNELPHF